MKMRWYGGRVSAEVHAAAINALHDGAEFILEESNRTVPHDEGTLQRSGDTDVDEVAMKALVSYDMPYTVRLHEHPEYRFQGGRRGKWLELTLKEQKDALRKFFAERLKKPFRR